MLLTHGIVKVKEALTKNNSRETLKREKEKAMSMYAVICAVVFAGLLARLCIVSLVKQSDSKFLYISVAVLLVAIGLGLYQISDQISEKKADSPRATRGICGDCHYSDRTAYVTTTKKK